MPDIFSSVLNSDAVIEAFSVGSFLLCTLVSLILGAAIALLHTFRNERSRGFLITLALLPAIVQLIIMVVNGNIGTGVAVAGAFSLIRFRSVPGSAREICSIFMGMAAGLATGMGYLAVAILFVLIIGIACMLYVAFCFKGPEEEKKDLRITIPESLNYTGVFDDLFEKYTLGIELVNVKTTNMGSLYKLNYRIQLKNPSQEKDFIDELRCRNGNLEISCGKITTIRETL